MSSSSTRQVDQGKPFEAWCRGEERWAVEMGVCPKIVRAGCGSRYHACGKTLQDGSRYCWRHQGGQG